ncbi:COQ9 family protein [Shimia sp.]|uniref:COQ9 family protein n=1 Tax=Shimia sp. TaxID=1954381 RepID=UPI003297FB3D
MSQAPRDDLKTRLLDAAALHVPFDGWSETTFEAAVAECDVDPVVAHALFPRGAVDLAVAFHKQGDSLMSAQLAAQDLSEMKIREKITHAVRVRLEICPDREVVRRGSTLFALPKYAPTGAELIWGTADAIWTAIGDTSEDVNWYTKRATLSGVYGATVLYWLGDDSEGHEATWAFLDRRIENVMQFEKVKAQMRNGPLGKLMSGPLQAMGRIRAPSPMRDMPGQWRRPNT